MWEGEVCFTGTQGISLASELSAQGLVPLRWGCALPSPNAKRIRNVRNLPQATWPPENEGMALNKGLPVARCWWNCNGHGWEGWTRTPRKRVQGWCELLMSRSIQLRPRFYPESYREIRGEWGFCVSKAGPESSILIHSQEPSCTEPPSPAASLVGGTVPQLCPQQCPGASGLSRASNTHLTSHLSQCSPADFDQLFLLWAPMPGNH